MQPEMMSSSDETQAGEVEVSKASGNYVEKRKSSKPVMEKRRRARINNSLNQLKSILLEALKKDCTRHSKLEKADILEMTVTYLKNVERQRLSMSLSIDPHVVDKYKAGFNECRNEVTRFLSTCEGVTVDVRTRLLSHLASCIRCIQSLQTQANGLEDNACESLALQTSIFPTNNHGSSLHNITFENKTGVFGPEENLRFSNGPAEINSNLSTSYLPHKDHYDQSVSETRGMASMRLNNVDMVLPEMVRQGSMSQPEFRDNHISANKNKFSSPKKNHLKEGNPVTPTSFTALKFSTNETSNRDSLSHHFPQQPLLVHSFSPSKFSTKVAESVDSEQNASPLSSSDSVNSDRETSPREYVFDRPDSCHWTNSSNLDENKTRFYHSQSTQNGNEKVSLKRSNIDNYFEDNKRKRRSKFHTINKPELSQFKQRSLEQMQYPYTPNDCEFINRNNEFTTNCAVICNRTFPETQNPLKQGFKGVKHDRSKLNTQMQTTRTHFKKSNPWRPWSDGRSLEEITQ